MLGRSSYVERQNLTMRMHMRRFTRLTNAFSKKLENHCHAIALHFVYYNFAKIHKSLRVTPAMQAGITKRVMSLEDIANLVEVSEPKKRVVIKRKVKAAIKPLFYFNRFALRKLNYYFVTTT